MEFDPTWILLGLPVAFALGWLASRLDLRQMRVDNRRSPKAYFTGLNHLLNEQHDKAIDAFIEAVQKDPDTSELHFALGNLFRRRGEYERAVRVHQHLLSRADLSRADRDRAQHALAQDYLKAGLLDRAEDALVALEGSAHENQARLALLMIYERSRDWAKASEIAARLEQTDQGSFATRRAHYLCEQADDLRRQAARTSAGDANSGADLLTTASQHLAQALELSPLMPRAALGLAELELQQGHADQAWARLVSLCNERPHVLPLAAAQMARTAEAAGQTSALIELFGAHIQSQPSIDTMDALAQINPEQARQAYLGHLEKESSLLAAQRLLARDDAMAQGIGAPVRRALDHAARPLSRYRCAACGFEAKRHFWQCPGCQSWDSYPFRRVEEL